MKTKLIILLLALSSLSEASQLDSKSLFIGVGLGTGTFATRTYIAKPVAQATKKAARKCVHVVTLGKK
jgi:hypothetical protein